MYLTLPVHARVTGMTIVRRTRGDSRVRAAHHCCQVLAPTVVFFFLLTTSQTPLAAMESSVVPIEEALRRIRGDDPPGAASREVTVRGALTTVPVSVSTSAVVGYLEDATGAIQLFWRGAAQDATSAFQRGDVVEVQGRVELYRGAAELVVGRVARLHGGPPPAPRDVRVGDLRDRRLAAHLVRLNGTLLVSGKQGTQLTLRDPSGEIPVFVPARLLRDIGFASRLMRGGTVALVGIADPQGGSESHPVVRVVVNDATDVESVASSRMGMVLIVVLLVSAAAVIYSWSRRRHADRRADALAVLSESLRQSEDAVVSVKWWKSLSASSASH